MRISDWSSDVCSSDLLDRFRQTLAVMVMDRKAEGAGARCDRLSDSSHADDAKPLSGDAVAQHVAGAPALPLALQHHLHALGKAAWPGQDQRSEEHTSELQSLMRISYPVVCLKK